ncbi:hypothetical protein TNCV_4498451 [Trichonephila clavipes]|nr:hypothetical protein TNCV_4498451 [Trichonephila clavipes]
MNKVRKTHARLECPTVSSKEFVAVDVCTAPSLLEFVQSSKNIIDTDFDDVNEMNNAAPVPTSSEMRNVMKNMRSYLDTHSNDEMNNKIVDSLMLKKKMQKKKSDYFPKTQ